MKNRWKTKDGEYLLPRQMHDTHLLNTIRFIFRNMNAIYQYEGDCISYMGSVFSNGEEAQRELENSFDSYLYDGSALDYIEEETPILNMIEEAEKRGLIEPWTGGDTDIKIKKVKPEDDFPDDLS